MSDQGLPPKGLERRMVLRLLRCWREAGGADGIPQLNNFNQDALAELWPDCYLLDLVTDKAAPRLEKIGESFLGELGCDLVGQPISDIPDGTLLKVSMGHLERVLSKGVPISLGGQFTNSDQDTVLYRCILLPLSDDNQTINQLLGAANSRVLAED